MIVRILPVWLCVALLVWCNFIPLAAQEAKPKKKATPAKEDPDRPKYSRPEWFELMRTKYARKLEKLADDISDAQAKVDELSRQQSEVTEEFVEKLLTIIEKRPEDETSLGALLEILNHRIDALTDEQTITVFKLLTEHHAASEKVIEICQLCGELESNEEIEAFLKAVVDKNTNPLARAWALFAQGTSKYHAADAKNDAEGFAEAEKLFSQVVKAIPADKTEGTPFDAAEKYLFELRNLTVGKEAPDFELDDLEGKPHSLRKQRGKIVILDFWATWCGFCIEMIPHEREMMKKLADKPVALISISADDSTDTVREFINEHPMPWTHWWNGPTGGVVEAWNIQGFPMIYVLDAKGIVRYRNIREAELENAVKTLLAEMEQSK